MKIKFRTAAVLVAFGLAAIWRSELLAQNSPGSMGTMTITFTYKDEIVARGEFKDRTTINQSAKIVCPLTAGDPMTMSSISGPSAEQQAAHAELGAAAKKEAESVSPAAVSGMKSLEQRMKSCKVSGKSEQICGMEAMLAMQSDPELLEQMGRIGSADPSGMAKAENSVLDAQGDFQPWYSEECACTMTVDNTFQVDDPTIPGPEPVIHTSGTREFRNGESMVTVETDLKRNETRYMITAPQESFTREGYPGEAPRLEMLSAIPLNPLLAGPYPGPIQSGRFEKKLAAGFYSVEWSFTRGG